MIDESLFHSLADDKYKQTISLYQSFYESTCSIFWGFPMHCSLILKHTQIHAHTQTYI